MPKRLPKLPDAPEGLDQDDPKTVAGSGDGTISQSQLNDPACYRSGRANFSSILENQRKNPATSSCASVSYTKPLHNEGDDLTLSIVRPHVLACQISLKSAHDSRDVEVQSFSGEAKLS